MQLANKKMLKGQLAQQNTTEREPAILSKGCFVLLTVYALKRFFA